MSQTDLDTLPSSFWKLCEIEGIRKDGNPLQEAAQKKSVEIFMQHGYWKIESLQYFPNITELIIIQQDIRKIENLSPAAMGAGIPAAHSKSTTDDGENRKEASLQSPNLRHRRLHSRGFPRSVESRPIPEI